MDSSGYPLGLKGEKINIYSRIIAVADINFFNGRAILLNNKQIGSIVRINPAAIAKSIVCSVLPICFFLRVRILYAYFILSEFCQNTDM